MMKKSILFVLLLNSVLLVAQRVGINTETPDHRYQLDVNGDILVEQSNQEGGYLRQDDKNTLNFSFDHLVVSEKQGEDFGKIKKIEPFYGKLAPAVVVSLNIKNVNGVNVDLNTGLPDSDYIVYVAEAIFRGRIPRNASGDNIINVYPTEYSYVESVDGTYRLKLGFNGIDQTTLGDIEGTFPEGKQNTGVKGWTCKLIILSKKK
ncbi:hypothetical protein [Riemerella columbipharyngis]|nr:hypothetical protein [Riemerella columbipharyngis]